MAKQPARSFSYCGLFLNKQKKKQTASLHHFYHLNGQEPKLNFFGRSFTVTETECNGALLTKVHYRKLFNISARPHLLIYTIVLLLTFHNKLVASRSQKTLTKCAFIIATISRLHFAVIPLSSNKPIASSLASDVFLLNLGSNRLIKQKSELHPSPPPPVKCPASSASGGKTTFCPPPPATS